MLHFDEFDLDTESGALWKGGIRVKLQPQPMRILCLLVNRAGQLVSREQIQKHIWAEETFVDFEHGLNYSIRSIRAALGDDADTPRYIETEPRRGYRFISNVTRAAAPTSLAPSSLDKESVSLGVASLRVESASQQKRNSGFLASKSWTWALLVAVGILCYPAYRVSSHLRSRTNASASATTATFLPARPSIAVLGFNNLSRHPEEAWLSTALSEMLSTELAAGRAFRTIPEENIARMKIDLALGEVDSYTPETLKRIRQYSGTETVVSGSYLLISDKENGQLRVDFRLQNTATGETTESISQVGTQKGLFTLISQAGAQLRNQLGAQAISEAEATGVQSSLPSRTQAAQFYSQGLDKLRGFDASGAKDLLQKAVATEPEYSLAHAALASSWSALGYDARARHEAEIAVQRSEGLPREDRLWVEGQYRVVAHEWPRAIQIYQTLATFYPDNLDYALRLGESQLASGDAAAALITASSLRQLPPPIAEDPRIDYLEVKANDSVGDYVKVDTSAERAIQNAKRHGAALLVAQTLRLACWSSMMAGHPEKALSQCEEARQLFSHAGDKGGVAAALGNQAAVLHSQGNSASALEKYEQALSVFREIGDQRRTAAVLINAGNIVPEGARKQKMYEEALSIYRTIGDQRGQSMGLGNLGNSFVAAGNLPEADGRYQEALVIARKLGDKNLVAIWLDNDSEIVADRGDLTRAKKMAAEALTIDQTAGDFFQASDDLLRMGDILREQGDLLDARHKYSEAMELRKKLGDPIRVAEMQLALAELLLDEGDWKSAISSLQDALPKVHVGSLVDDELLATTMLAEALLGQGDNVGAEGAVKSGQLLRKPEQKHGTQFHDVNVRFGIVGNRLLALTKPAEASSALQLLLKDANRRQYVGQGLQIRLVIGELELRSSNRAAAHDHLVMLANDARESGFTLIANKATGAERRTNANLR